LANPHVFFLFFTPYIILSLSLFAITFHSRKYKANDIVQGILLNAVSFPVYMKASLFAMLGVKGTFGITPKSGSSALPLAALWPQILTALIAFGAVIWGVHRLFYERETVVAVVINSFWSLYHVVIILSVLYFNYPLESEDK
jgi:cellulose synthase (UDP-forming)